MGRRYFCDYCEKSFIDEIDARNKHLHSSHHIKLRNNHFESFKDLETVLKEESQKIPCRRFLQNGFCPFEMMCKYTHYSQVELWDMQNTLMAYKLQEQQKQYQMEHPNVPLAEEWIDNYNKRKNSENQRTNKEFWTYPSHLESILDLPPSMKKLCPEDVADNEFAEWGL